MAFETLAFVLRLPARGPAELPLVFCFRLNVLWQWRALGSRKSMEAQVRPFSLSPELPCFGVYWTTAWFLSHLT